MEDNNYYTPSIEEFHVGFKYEGFHHSSCFKLEDDKKDNWNPYVFNGRMFINIVDYNNNPPKNPTYDYYIQELLDKNMLRVKHLDKEDIEELGWEFDTILTKLTSRFVYKDYILSFNTENNRIRIAKDFELLFDGTVKNYNELTRLMNQLNMK